jgi:activator of Hsp90 ATPase-like protein
MFREIHPPERIVHTEQMDGAPGEALNTTLLTEQGGRTTLTLTMLFDSKRPATPPSRPAWRKAWPSATTGWRSSWRRRRCGRIDRGRPGGPLRRAAGRLEGGQAHSGRRAERLGPGTQFPSQFPVPG